MNKLRFTPTGIDNHAFEIKRYRINNLYLAVMMVIFMVMALIFGQWAKAMGTDTTDMVLIPKGELTMDSKNHNNELQEALMRGHPPGEK